MPYDEDLYEDENLDTVKDAKLKLFAQHLKRCDGYVSAAARMSGISRDTAHRWINKHRRLRNLVDRLRATRDEY